MSNGPPSDRAAQGALPDQVADPLLPGMPLDQIGQALAAAYDDLLAEGVPEQFAGLIKRVAEPATGRPRKSGRLALIVEDEPEVRALAETILDETELQVLGVDSAEEALVVLRDRGGEIALVFADIRLAGAMDGVQLAHAVATLWPKARLVVTSGIAPERCDEIPSGAVFIPKPWRARDVRLAAERAGDDPLPPAAA